MLADQARQDKPAHENLEQDKKIELFMVSLARISISTMIFLSFFFHSEDISCQFRSLLVKFGCLQFTSTIITTLIEELVTIEHGQHMPSLQLVLLDLRGCFLLCSGAA